MRVQLALGAATGAFALLLLSSCANSNDKQARVKTAQPPCSPAMAQQPTAAQTPVRVEMRNVIFRDDPASVLRIQSFEGSLLPTRPGVPPTFDDKQSFRFGVDSAVILTTGEDMTALFNGSVFNYDHSPLTNVKVHTRGSRLYITATLHKGVPLPIELLGDVGVTPDGKMSITAQKVDAAHIPMKKMMKTFDIQMADLVDPKYARGVSIVGNTMVLDPQYLFPPPYKQARLTAVSVRGDNIVQSFGNAASSAEHERSSHQNFIRLHGGSVRFGKLEIRDADINILDAGRKTWFDFYIDHYRDQLAKSDMRITPDQQLEVYMPDFGDRKPVTARLQTKNNIPQ